MAGIDFDAIITDPDGYPVLSAMPTETEPNPGPTTLKMVAIGALLTQQPEDRGVPNLGYKLYTLTARIHKGGVLDLEAHDIALIKQRLEFVVTPWVLGRAWDLLEGRTEPLERPPEPSVTAVAPSSALRRHVTGGAP